MKTPYVLNYLDAYVFLQDIYKYFKSCDANFSYQIWSDQLAVKSKSYLRFTSLGRRKISDELLSKLSAWLNFQTEIEKKYFLLLVQYTQASHPEIKQIISRALIELIRLDQNAFEIQKQTAAGLNSLSLQIRDLVSYEDIQHSTESIAEHFMLSPNEILHHLSSLQKAELIKLTPENKWVSTHKSIKIADDFGNHTLHNIHEQNLLDSIKMIRTNVNDRKYRSLTFALSEQQFLALNEKISNYLTTQFNEYTQDPVSQGKKLYQINYNISPRTKEIRTL